MIRSSMRPVSLKRIIETASLSLSLNEINKEILSENLQLSQDRAREILRELKSMNFLDLHNEKYHPNANTKELILRFSEGNWERLHELFTANNKFYRTLLETMEEYTEGYTIEELLIKLCDNELHYNNASLEILLRWAERFNTVQRNLYENRFYKIRNIETDLNTFEVSLLKNYNKMNKKIGLFLTKTYIEIPRLREEVCEDLKIGRKDFDSLFYDYYKRFIGKVELAGAPTITAAKKSSSNIKKTRMSHDKNIISPIYELDKERKGIVIMGKSYFFIAIYNSNL